MARILPSGRVFGEASPLPSIQFAQYEHPLKTLQDAATSDLANMAVAGISRIKDEIDYADRVHAEKSRVAGAQIAERKAQAALGALQEQQAARTAAMEQHEAQRQQRMRTFAAETGQLDALNRGEEIDLTWRPVHKQVVDLGPAPGAYVAARMVEEKRRRELLERLSILESAAKFAEDNPGSADAEKIYGRIEQTLQEINALDEVPPGLNTVPGKGLLMEGGPVFSEPEYTGPEALEEGALAEAQAALAAAQKAAAVPMRFVPRTKAEFDYAISQETDPARKRLLFEQSRSAVDAQPDDVMQAIAGSAGREVQEDILKRIREAGAAKSKADAEGKKFDLEKRRVDAVIGANKQLEEQRKQSARKLGLEADKLGRLEERAKAAAKRGKRYAAEVASVLGIVGDAADALQAVGQAPTRGGLNAVLSPQQLNVRVEQSLAALPAKKRAEVVGRVKEAMEEYGDQYGTLGAYIRSASGGDGRAKGVRDMRLEKVRGLSSDAQSLNRHIQDYKSKMPLYIKDDPTTWGDMGAYVAQAEDQLLAVQQDLQVAYENMSLPTDEQYVRDEVTGAIFHVKEEK